MKKERQMTWRWMTAETNQRLKQKYTSTVELYKCLMNMYAWVCEEVYMEEEEEEKNKNI